MVQRAAMNAGALLGSCVAALVVAAGATGATGAQPHDYTAADQLLARVAVLTQRDVGPASVWRGGSVKPDDSFNPVCPSFHLRRADLVVTGEAESRYATTAAEVADSKAQFLRTAEMVQLDVQRNVDNPALVTCLRALAAGEKVSVTRLSLPGISGASTGGFRWVFRSRATKPSTPIPYLLDVLTIGRNRTEITLTTGGASAHRAAIEQLELRLARLLAARIAKRSCSYPAPTATGSAASGVSGRRRRWQANRTSRARGSRSAGETPRPSGRAPAGSSARRSGSARRSRRCVRACSSATQAERDDQEQDRAREGQEEAEEPMRVEGLRVGDAVRTGLVAVV